MAMRGARYGTVAAMTLALLAGCAARKPATAQPHLVAPPQCVKILAPIELDAKGQIDPKKKVPALIMCTEVAK